MTFPLYISYNLLTLITERPVHRNDYAWWCRLIFGYLRGRFAVEGFFQHRFG